MRKSKVIRNTNETKISVELNLDGKGLSKINSGIPFLDHMLEQISRHGLFDIEIIADGDLEVDAHHTVEDIGITLGQAFNKAISDKKGIFRYGTAYVPLDESLSRVVIDLSGRPGFFSKVSFKRQFIGDFDSDLIFEFFQGFVNHAFITIHVDNLKGSNSHHQAETIFKAFGRALRAAVKIDNQIRGVIPSTKAIL